MNSYFIGEDNYVVSIEDEDVMNLDEQPWFIVALEIFAQKSSFHT